MAGILDWLMNAANQGDRVNTTPVVRPKASAPAPAPTPSSEPMRIGGNFSGFNNAINYGQITNSLNNNNPFLTGDLDRYFRVGTDGNVYLSYRNKPSSGKPGEIAWENAGKFSDDLAKKLKGMGFDYDSLSDNRDKTYDERVSSLFNTRGTRLSTGGFNQGSKVDEAAQERLRKLFEDNFNAAKKIMDFGQQNHDISINNINASLGGAIADIDAQEANARRQYDENIFDTKETRAQTDNMAKAAAGLNRESVMDTLAQTGSDTGSAKVQANRMAIDFFNRQNAKNNQEAGKAIHQLDQSMAQAEYNASKAKADALNKAEQAKAQASQSLAESIFKNTTGFLDPGYGGPEEYTNEMRNRMNGVQVYNPTFYSGPSGVRASIQSHQAQAPMKVNVSGEGQSESRNS